jgi:hypothetical protein
LPRDRWLQAIALTVPATIMLRLSRGRISAVTHGGVQVRGMLGA